MNKFIAAFDGLKMSVSNVDYAIAMAKDSTSFLTGVFLDDRTYTSYKIYDLVMEQGVSEKKLKQYEHDDFEHRRRSSAIFTEKCEASGMYFNIHHDKNVALQELLHETVYSDLLIIAAGENFTHHEEKFPSRFIRDLLSDTQCPIMLTPQWFQPFTKVFFLFDGEPTSVYAMKMFTYLFPNYKELEVEVLTVKPMETTGHVPDNKLVKEWMKRHFRNAEFTVLKGIPSEEIIKYLKEEKQHSCVVLGAYRRTMVSRWFKSSLADKLASELDWPVFIAHNK